MQTYIKTDKLTALMHSRKFWALVMAEVTTWVGVFFHAAPPDLAILASVGALSAYMLGTGWEDGGTNKSQPPPTDPLALPPRG